jgi:hypothetical protein
METCLINKRELDVNTCETMATSFSSAAGLMFFYGPVKRGAVALSQMRCRRAEMLVYGGGRTDSHSVPVSLTVQT